jgi:hypothetical protein
MRSLPFPRRLQLVKLLRAHGLRDVERLREDELKDALARLSILMPDLTSEAPFVQAGPSSSSSSSLSSAALSSSALSSSAASSGAGERRARLGQAGPHDDDDGAGLPRFREPRVFLPNNERTFVRAIAVKPRVVFATWDTRFDVVEGPARLEVYTQSFLGAPPSSSSVLLTPILFSVSVDRTASGWYLDVPAERLAVVLRLVIDTDDGPVVVATSNVALTPPARPAPAGPLWMATLSPEVDRRTLRGAGLLRESLPEGASLETRGEALPENVLVASRAVADLPSSSFRFLHEPDDVQGSSSSSSSSFAGRPEART